MWETFVYSLDSKSRRWSGTKGDNYHLICLPKGSCKRGLLSEVKKALYISPEKCRGIEKTRNQHHLLIMAFSR